MTQKQLFENIFSGIHENCSYINSSMEAKIDEFSKLNGIPHCFFAELAKATYITPVSASTQGAISLFSSFVAFNESDISDKSHLDLSFMLLAEKLKELNISTVNFCGKNNAKIELKDAELDKLVSVASEVKENLNDEQAMEDLELEEGNEIVFSTPDPEIPENFINYLSETISPMSEIEEVYVFETMLEGDTESGLVIGVVPIDDADIEKIDNLAFILINGIEKYMEDRDQIDFMILDDDELIDIAQSVSPEIKLSR